MDSGEETYKYRYDASLANHIELKWQSKWEEDGTYHAPNPSGPLADSTGRIDLPKLFIMDMFPTPRELAFTLDILWALLAQMSTHVISG